MAKLSKNQQKHIRRTTPTLGGASNKRSAPRSTKGADSTPTPIPEEKISTPSERKFLTPEQPLAEATEVVASRPAPDAPRPEVKAEPAAPVVEPVVVMEPPLEIVSVKAEEPATNGFHPSSLAPKADTAKVPKVLQPIQPASAPRLFSRGKPGLSTERPLAKTAIATVTTSEIPVVAPLRTFWTHSTTQTLLWFVGIVLVTAVVGRQGRLDLTESFVSHNLSAHAPTSDEAAATPGTPFSPFGAGVSVPPAVAEEAPPLPPPARPGENKTLFTGQKIEESCVKKEGERCVAYSLDAFYASLAKTIRKEPESVLRVVHFGDSIIAADYISSRVRELMQNNFGDAGSGYIYLAKPSRWYYREGVKHDAGASWDTRTITSDKKADDHLYGLGGASFEALGPGIESSFATNDLPNAKFGKSVSRFVVHYLEQPNGGEMILLVDGKEHERFSTKGPEKKSAFKTVTLPDGAHKLSVKAGSGKVRGFGVVMERDEPGVIYDGLGLVSGSAKALLQIDAAHWQEQLRERNPNLIVFTFGTNEVGYTSVSEKWAKDYEEKYKTILTQVRQALPEAACLLMAPPDTDTKRDGVMVSWPALPRLIEAQRNAALASGCAYWDTFTWMGGKNSMAAWVKKGLGQNDYAHPTKKGAAKIGDAFFESLMAGYDAYVLRNQTPAK